ncbi:hypothetical protein D9Q98_003516 [Chlorella vulgaris]|uniref:BZIP domain-containing protein n=1 Tax=Chlorella vulgaris TaxID=3077 RepID=A0A9D4TSY3_CHLVU|nr:hypothetical protein D9Q98_003516 [Chlorella vulgaris]
MAFDEPAWPQTEFQLPDLDSLVHEGEPPPLDADLLAQFLSAAPPPTDFVPQMPSPASLQLTSSGGSSGTSTKPTSEEDRKERARALNRAKQARFRARQKERKAGMAQQYEAACADLERETELNASMKLTSTLLEAVKSQKDFAVEALEAASRGTCLALNKQGQEKEGALQSQQQGAQGAAQEASALSVISASVLTEHMWSLPFHERVDLCTRTFRATESAHQALKEQLGDKKRTPDGFSLAIDVKRRLAQAMMANHPQLLEATLAVTAEQLIQEWAHLGEWSAEVIQLYDAGTIDEEGVESRMCNPVMYFAILGALLLLHKPAVLQRLLENHLHPGETEESAVPRWRQVAVGMGVTAEQTASMLPMFLAHAERSRELGAATTLSMETLRAVQQELEQQMSALNLGLSAATQQYLRVFDAAGSLIHHSNAAVMLTMDFISKAGQYVTPLQKTRMMAMCRPLHPDVLTIVQEGLRHFGVLPERGESSAADSVAPLLAFTAAPPAEQPAWQVPRS